MANDSAASSARRRLARKTPPEQPVPPEVALARSLLKTEYAIRGRRPGNEARPTNTEGAWDQLADELGRFIDRLRGRSPSGGGAPSAGGGEEVGGGQEAGGFGRAEPDSTRAMRDGPPQRPLSAPSPLSSRAAFEGTVNGLPPHAREAFEDAVLELVRTEKKWKKAYDRSPTSMPSVAMYANNAYMRELRRNAPPSADPPTRERSTSRGDVPRTVTAAEAMTNARTAIMAQDQEQFERLRARWERPAAGQRDSAAASARSSSARSSFDYPRENEMSDGGAFQAAQRAQYVWSTDNSRNPGQDQLSDALGFQAAEEARLERVTAGATGPTPTPVQEAEQAHHAWNNADFSNPGREPMSDGTAFLSARTTPQFGSTAPLSFAPPSPVTPVSPLPGSAVPATSGPPPLLSDEGRTILGGSMASTRSASASRGGDSPSRSTASVHAGQNTNTPAPRARRA